MGKTAHNPMARYYAKVLKPSKDYHCVPGKRLMLQRHTLHNMPLYYLSDEFTIVRCYAREAEECLSITQEIDDTLPHVYFEGKPAFTPSNIHFIEEFWAKLCDTRWRPLRLCEAIVEIDTNDCRVLIDQQGWQVLCYRQRLDMFGASYEDLVREYTFALLPSGEIRVSAKRGEEIRGFLMRLVNMTDKPKVNLQPAVPLEEEGYTIVHV